MPQELAEAYRVIMTVRTSLSAMRGPRKVKVV